MANSQDFTAVFKDMMNSFPVDTKSMEDAYKSQATLTEKLSAVSLSAAQESTKLSAKWADETFKKMQELTKAKSEPADYAKSMSDFASASAESTAEHLAAFAEIAKKVQTQTMELMMAAGKDMSEDMQKHAKKVTEDMSANAKKAASATK